MRAATAYRLGASTTRALSTAAAPPPPPFPFFNSTAAEFVRDHLAAPGGDLHAHPETPKRFPDGGQYRVEM